MGKHWLAVLFIFGLAGSSTPALAQVLKSAKTADTKSESTIKKTFREFDRVIGRARLAAIHLNDSTNARASRVDRHAHIGKGQIGLAAFRFIMNDRRFRKIPKVLETPKGKELREDVVNLRVLRRLVQIPQPRQAAERPVVPTRLPAGAPIVAKDSYKR